MVGLAYLVYDLLLLVVILFYLPVLLYKVIIKEETFKGFKERLGFLDRAVRVEFENEKTIWVHAASVGETGAASPLVAELKERFPGYKILFSTMTNTGQQMARKIVKEADEFIYLPVDLPWLVKRVMKRIKPQLLVIMETELWPNLVKEAKKGGAKVMLASGRISDSSFKKYDYFSFILQDMLDNIDLFSMQSREDMERILQLGADESKVCNNGNTKFDQEYGSINPEDKERIYQEFKLSPKDPIIVAGSTHDDEEERLLPLYKRLKDRFPDLVLILVPRYVERSSQIEELYNQAGIKTVRRSRISQREEEDLIIVDTIGELARLYGIATLVFVGGSLIKRGGHNILEPASCGKPVFFGPYMFNFKESTRLLLKNEVGIQIADVEELIREFDYYLSNPSSLADKSKKALELISKNRGASRRNAELTYQLVKQKRILLVRLSAIGDVIHTLPVAKVVRDAYPQAQISWIVESKAKDLVIDNPYLDQVILLPKEEWKDKFKKDRWGTLKEAKEFFARLKRNNFDLVLDLHGLFKSGLTSFLSGAPLRVGAATGREGSRFFYNRKVKLPEGEIHQVERALYLAQAIGAEVKEIDYGIRIDKECEEKIDKRLASFNFKVSDKLVAINPFTSWESKDWPKERYAQLADRLISDFDYKVIFTGGSADINGIDEIIRIMEQSASNWAGQTDLKELATLYQKAALFIGGDTGPMHLAAAMKTPVIALFGPTSPQTHGPYGKGHTVIKKDIECGDCWKRVCPNGTRKCMKGITVEEILVAVSNQLSALSTQLSAISYQLRDKR